MVDAPIELSGLEFKIVDTDGQRRERSGFVSLRK
jgi:hypothetical protein